MVCLELNTNKWTHRRTDKWMQEATIDIRYLTATHTISFTDSKYRKLIEKLIVAVKCR